METEKNRELIDRLLQAQSLPLHGYCSFKAVSDRLIPCRALGRMKAAFQQDSPPQTVIAALFPYRTGDEPGNLARYARVPDYHVAAGRVLEQAAKVLSDAFHRYTFLSFIDNSPIPEVRAAALAGLGCIGDHGLLIHPVYGSWVFIGTIVTDLPVALPDQKTEPCSHCGKCARACPGGCVGCDSRETCVSRISQIKGQFSPEQAELLMKSGMVWGCDRCQEICPLNENAKIQPHPCFDRTFPPWLTCETVNDLEGRAYGWRGADVLKRNLSLFDK